MVGVPYPLLLPSLPTMQGIPEQLMKTDQWDCSVQGCIDHEKQPPPRTLRQAYAQGPMVVLGGWVFLMSEVPL